MLRELSKFTDEKSEELGKMVDNGADNYEIARFFGDTAYGPARDIGSDIEEMYEDLIRPYGEGHPLANITYDLSAVTIGVGGYNMFDSLEIGSFQMLFGAGAIATTEGWMRFKEDDEAIFI